MTDNQKPLISVVLPCLNEEKTILQAISWAKQGLQKLSLRYRGEIIVVDNGSTDQSVALSKKTNVRVLIEKKRGYGQSYLTGLKHAHGDIFIIGDSDGTYDFRTLSPFVKKIENGADIVLGSRIKGTIKIGAMPFSHRFIGTPLLTAMLNISYGTHISDAHTGMRALRRSAYKKMNLRSPGMEFASEMIVKAIYHNLAIEEVPINYYPRIGTSKLSPLKDAWRHIKFMILFAPTYAFVVPGFMLFILGIFTSLFLLSHGQYLFGWFFDIHTMSIGMLATNLGLELLLLGLFAKAYTQKSLHLPSGPLATILLKSLTVERLLLFGVILFLIAISIMATITIHWITSGFGNLSAIRTVLFATGIGAIGAQCIFASFLYGLIKES